MSASPPENPAACCRQCGSVLSADGTCAKCLLETGISAEGLTKAERLFQAALSHDENERTAFVEQVAGGNAALLAEVWMLLDGYAQEGGDLAVPTMGSATNARAQWAAGVREAPGTVIDHYRLVRLIGEGGMGSVWEAKQTAPIQRRVALKVIKLGMDTEEVVRRFARERSALALMTHPHIAQVFEAGATPLGRPYFAMELVEGEAITAHCRAARLGVRERLALFLDVCGAVEHAHQKGVIHRDLKPSNILVAGGMSNVIDFGVAKATQEEAGDGLFTRQAHARFGLAAGAKGEPSRAALWFANAANPRPGDRHESGGNLAGGGVGPSVFMGMEIRAENDGRGFLRRHQSGEMES